MAISGYRLSVDFGTSATVAVLAGPSTPAKPLLFDASPLLPSAVFARPGDDELLTGADAERGALVHPAGFEANPKRRIDDGVIWLAEREFTVIEVVAAVLSRVGGEARRVAGGPPTSTVLTHPAAWSRTRLGILAAAAEQAQLGECHFVPEPVAAAAYFARVLDKDLPTGRCLIVYDLGAGTCDVSAVRRSPHGLDVVATAGLDDVGGVDLDAVVVNHARSLTAAATDAWSRLDWPRTAADQQARHLLWRGARAAKEQLSRHSTADLHVPLVDTVIHMTRDEFEAAARPLLDRTTDLTTHLLRDAGIARQEVAGVFLVGGSTRVPLVASLLHRALRIAPTVLDHPELVVAEGGLHVLRTTPPAAAPPPAPVPTTPPPAPVPATPVPAIRPATPTREAPTPTLAPAPAEPTPPVATPADSAPEPRPTPRPAAPDVTLGSKTANRLAGAAILARLLPAWPPRTRRDKVIVGCAVAVVLAVFAVIGLRTYQPGGAVATWDAEVSLTAVAFSPDGKTLATPGPKNTVRLWNVATGEVTKILGGHKGPVHSMAFSPDGKTLATAGTTDDTVRLWNMIIGTSTRHLYHRAPVNDVAFSPDGKTLATVGWSDGVRLWAISSGETVVELGGPDSFVLSVAFSPDGTLLATGTAEDSAVLWDVSTAEDIRTLTGHNDDVVSLAFSPDGRTLATAGGNSVRLWNLNAGVTGTALTGHTDAVLSVAFSPDGKLLATGSSDKSVRLWDVATRKTVATFSGHTDDVAGVAFSPDGKLLATVSHDDTVRLWRIDV